ncbi:helix-turn-helix domain-containing protein [Nocardioides sp. LHD-245]|uniref:TetR/AcrR family transcriptional regulator n=1 Tax=Nocardioides sp. LHD-245 TaxID=3051387 RepID=UPI0027DF9271|nr:helix-turn-helix domain-containing protein [Nocardioides sp. LHD-245]
MARAGRPRTFDRTAALHAAMELFWRHGYEGVSMKMIETRLGLAPTSVYAAFGSKEALFEEAVELYDPDGDTLTDRALGLTGIRDSIEALLRDNAEAYVDPTTPAGCMLVLAAVNLGAGHDQVGERLARRRHRDAEKIRRRIERARAEGELPLGLDVDRAAALLVTILHGLSIQARDGYRRDQVLGIVDAAMLGWDALVRAAS